jgi:protein-S-isoprenylcysteine O-methyltransferase Ste14
MILMLLGLALAMGSAPFYVIAVSYGFVIDRVFCPYEEHKSLAEFGDHYRAYAENVRRWL